MDFVCGADAPDLDGLVGAVDGDVVLSRVEGYADRSVLALAVENATTCQNVLLLAFRLITSAE